MFSLELYEGFKHFHSLRRYLDAIGYEPAITDEELVAIRQKQAEIELVDRRASSSISSSSCSPSTWPTTSSAASASRPRITCSPICSSRIAADEVRHAQSASDLIAKRIAMDPSVIPQVLDAALDFHHFGEQAIGTVPIAQPGDPIAIQTFARRIERLCGIRLVDHIKNTNLNRRAS